MVRKPSSRRSKNVAKLNNEYVSTLQEKENWKNKQRVRLKRNLSLLTLIVVLSFGVLLNMFFGQKKILAVKEDEKSVLLAELKIEEEEQVQLMRQLEKLNDDEYIAKLARQEYFLSDENEVIFSIPKNEKQSKKKKEEKE